MDVPTQLGDLVDLARAFPETQIVLGHVGGAIGLGSYAGRRDEVFAAWSRQIHELAACPNVRLKLGRLGLGRSSASPDAPRVTARGPAGSACARGMRMFGFTHHMGELPPTSEELAGA